MGIRGKTDEWDTTRGINLIIPIFYALADFPATKKGNTLFGRKYHANEAPEVMKLGMVSSFDPFRAW